MADARRAFLARVALHHQRVEAGDLTIDEAFRDLGLPACDTCGGQPCVNPSFCAACRLADARLRQERRR